MRAVRMKTQAVWVFTLTLLLIYLLARHTSLTTDQGEIDKQEVKVRIIYQNVTSKECASHPKLIPTTPRPHACAQRRALQDDYTEHCHGFLQGDFTKYDQAKHLMRVHPERGPLPMDALLKDLEDCSKFKATRSYTDKPTPDAEDMPIAYSIVFHRDVGQVERLLKAIYQPHNSYCLHVDAKSSKAIQTATASLANCFPNVFIASRLEHVVYASVSRLQADINCMKDLVRKESKWKYLINLTGQVYPLKTNAEIARILRIYNGANDIEGTGRGTLLGVAHRYQNKWKFQGNKPRLVKLKDKHPPPPHNINLIKGSAFGVFSRAFVEFVLNDQKAKDLLEWSKDTYSPDEIYWATLNHPFVNPMLPAPGGYSSAVPDRKPWVAMYSSWKQSVPRGRCSSSYMRNICIFTLKDLPDLISRNELFANKFYAEKEPMVTDCIDYYLQAVECAQLPFNSQFYRDLPFVKGS